MWVGVMRKNVDTCKQNRLHVCQLELQCLMISNSWIIPISTCFRNVGNMLCACQLCLKLKHNKLCLSLLILLKHIASTTTNIQTPHEMNKNLSIFNCYICSIIWFSGDSVKVITRLQGNDVPEPIFLNSGRYTIELVSGFHVPGMDENLGFNMSYILFQSTTSL